MKTTRKEALIITQQFWVDQNGKSWKTPQIKGRLKFRIPSHSALRAYVFFRDNNRCVYCGSTDRLVADHVLSRKNGGSHHPSNLQTLCMKCNARKVTTVDKNIKGR